MICYNKYGDWIRKRFGCKVQKISIDAGFSCPNRDGTIGRGGCIYCNNATFNPEYCTDTAGRGSQEERLNLSADNIRRQLETGKGFFSRKYPEMKYIAYFQSYTNTYGDIEALKRLYDQGIYTPQSLDQAIQKALPINSHYVKLSSNQKPKGNLKRYDVGTAVDIPVSHELNYFMIGVSSFNVDLKAETSRDEYVLAIQRMIDFYDAHSQGYPILMPIIGGFLSRTGQSEIDLLKFIIRTLKLNEDHINSDIYIVIREGAKNTISLFNLI